MLAIPDRYRTYAYFIFAALGVAIGSVQVGYAAAEAGQPVWLTVALAVFAYVGGAIGFTAGTHVPAAPDAQLSALAAHARVQGHHTYVGEHRD